MKHFWGIVLRWKFWAVVVLFFSWNSIIALFPKKNQGSSYSEEKTPNREEDRLPFRREPQPPEANQRGKLEAELSNVQERYEQNQKEFYEDLEERNRQGATGLEDYWMKRQEVLFQEHNELKAKILEIEHELKGLE